MKNYTEFIQSLNEEHLESSNLTPEILLWRIFFSRDFAHIAHLGVDSYDQHKVLQEYYENIIPLIDSAIEAHQAIHGIIPPIYNQIVFSKESLVNSFENLGSDIENYREFFSDDVIAIMDSILELIHSTLYKLKTFTK